MERCKWHNLERSATYQEYHDNEWGVESHDDRYLFEMLVLESFHCGLSWLIVLKKRAAFIEAFDRFDVQKVAEYGEEKISELLNNKGIIRSIAKIRATISNAQAFIKIQQEFGSFDRYIWSFTQGKQLKAESDEPHTTNALSDQVSKELKRRGFKFMGSVTTYSYLEAIGVMDNHISSCFKHYNATK